MAGSIVITNPKPDRYLRPVRKWTLAWTSDALGAVSGIKTPVVCGQILRVAFVPGAGGVQPTNLYDVTLLDSDGLDVLAGQGANLSNATKSHVCPGIPLKDGTTTSVLPVAVDSTLELTVAAAGDAKQGAVILYVGSPGGSAN